MRPAAILLEQSALPRGPKDLSDEPLTLGASVAVLAESAPVIVMGLPEDQAELAVLISKGAVDFVARAGDYLPVASGLLERRLRQADNTLIHPHSLSTESGDDFGEVLRHEVNNPLTGILGNAELLLAQVRRRNDGGLPQGAIQRLQTIAELAVRLRETVRRLSCDLQNHHNHIA